MLEGFDFGVGALLPFLPRNERDRRAMFDTIGPVWDGNEVWLVVAGGATFAAFPAWYATVFSGFYLALLLVLVLLIVRVVSFEWREKSEDPRWRATWLWANTVGSVGAAVRLGRGAGELRARRAARLEQRLRGRLLGPLQRLHGLRRARGRAAVRLPRRRPFSTLRTIGRAVRAGGAQRPGGSPCRPPSAPAASSPGRSPSRSTATTRTSSRPCSRRRSAIAVLLLAVVFVFGAPQRLGVRDDRARNRRRRGHPLHEPLSARARLPPGLRATA